MRCTSSSFICRSRYTIDCTSTNTVTQVFCHACFLSSDVVVNFIGTLCVFPHPCNIFPVMWSFCIWNDQVLPSLSPCTLGDDNVSMLTHTYPHKPVRNINWPSSIIKSTVHVVCGVMSGLVIRKHRQVMVIHDTECPH